MQELIRDGVRLCYEEAGSGSPPILFVHGWCCNHTYFEPQFRHFSKSHRVISVDLRGHGNSDKPLQDYSMEGFADDLAWMCTQLNVQSPIAIGHSMGGIVALVMAARYPDLVRAAVQLDSPVVPAPNADLNARRGILDALQRPDYMDAAKAAVERMFVPTDDAQRKAWIVESMTSAPQHVMLACIQASLALDMRSTAETVKQPLLAITAGPRDFAPYREAAPQLMAGVTVGTGHFNQLEAPEQVNAMIEHFFKVVSLV